MNKKVLSAILFSALFAGTGTFTSCIDNDEPAGIEELRGAKAELIRAKVAVEQAEAAYKLAQAEVEKANAAIKNAQAENQKALNEYQELLNERQSITNAEAQAELDAKIAKAEMKAKEAQLKHEEEMVKLNQSLAIAQRNYELTLAQIEIAKATMSESAYITVGSLQAEVSDAQGDVEAAQARVANAEDAYYIATLMVKSGEVDMKKLEAAVAGAEATLAAKQEAYDKFTNFLADEKETAEWRAEVAEIEATIDSLNAELKLVELAEAKAKESEEYKALEAAVVAARKAKNEAEKDLKLEEDLSYTYMYLGGVKDHEGKIAAKTTLVNAGKELAGVDFRKSEEYAGAIAELKKQIASYTTEKQYWLDSIADMAGSGAVAAEKRAKNFVKTYNEKKAAYESALKAKDLNAKAIFDSEKATGAYYTFSKALKDAEELTGTEKTKAILKAEQAFADALVAFYNTLPAAQVTLANVSLPVTVGTGTSAQTVLQTKSVKAWLSDVNKDVYLNQLKKYFKTYQALWQFVDGAKAEKLDETGKKIETYATCAFTSWKNKSDLLDVAAPALKKASDDAFGPAENYANNAPTTVTDDWYLRNEPTLEDIKYVASLNLSVGEYGKWILSKDVETAFEAKNYKAIIADLQAAVEFWTATVEDIKEALTAQDEAVEAAKEALTAAKEAVKEYEEANFTFEATEAAFEAQIESLENVKEALGDAIAYFLGVNSYDGTEEFEKWLNKKAAKALDAVYDAEKALIDAQNTLAMAQDGKSGVWEYMATVEAELADAMAELEAAQDELEAALANLAKGLEILAETNAK